MQRLKLSLKKRSAKTVNNVLTVLNKLLKTAVEWGELEKVPCTIKLLPNPKRAMGFHDFENTTDWSKRRSLTGTPIWQSYWAAKLGSVAVK